MPENDESLKKILVVDDELNIRKLIGNVLNKVAEYEVDVAEDGQAALEWLEARGFDCDLVVTDMQMPRLNGEELISKVMESHPDIPMIVLTAHKNDKNVVQCLELGAVEYLTKPISVEKLILTVRRVFDRHSRFKGIGEDVTISAAIQGWVELTAPTDFEYVERFRKFTGLLSGVPLSDEAKEDIRVAIDEIGQNAVEWGNRHDRNKKIHLSYCIFKDRIVFKIEDEGEGFTPETLRDPSVDPLAHIMKRMEEGKRAGGYGVFITKKLMDDILYSETGSAVLMTKYFMKDRGGDSL